MRAGLEDKFQEVSINWGPKISFFGQSFDLGSSPFVKVRMEGYVADLHIRGVKGLAATPALGDFFDIKVKETLLDADQKENSIHSSPKFSSLDYEKYFILSVRAERLPVTCDCD